MALAEYRHAELDESERYDKACLEREDFEKVCEMAGAFKAYLQSVSGFDEVGRAKGWQDRNDEHKSVVV